MTDQYTDEAVERLNRAAASQDESAPSDVDGIKQWLGVERIQELNRQAKSREITPAEYHRQRLNLILQQRVRAFSPAEILRASATGGRGFMYPHELQAAVTWLYLRSHLDMPANARVVCGDFRAIDEFVIGARDGYVAWAQAQNQKEAA